METKPFDLQSPEQIAKDYMGNKQKIAAAAQMGTVDPTAAVLAGMFIDRMRAAQVQEAQPPQTVAQDVLAPQAGLGAMSGAPPMGASPMGAPPMGAPPMGAPPMGAPPVGMAGGGLADLDVPDDMFPDDNYAGGGMVSFDVGGPVPAAPVAAAPVDPFAYRPLEEIIAERERLLNPSTARRDNVTRYWEEQMSPEAQSRQRKDDMWSTLAQIGFGMAGSNSPSFLQSAGQAASAALPGAQQMARERRAQVRQGMSALADIEGMTNAERRAVVTSAIDSQDRGSTVRESRAEAERGRAHDSREGDATRATQMAIARLNNPSGGGSSGGGGGGGATIMERYAREIYASLRDNPANANYTDAQLRRQATQTAVRELAAAEGGGDGGSERSDRNAAVNVTRVDTSGQAQQAPREAPQTQAQRAAAFAARSEEEERAAREQRAAIRAQRVARARANEAARIRRRQVDAARAAAHARGEVYRREQ